MFIFDRNSNRISKLEQKSFDELGFKEREHVQEWLVNHPDALGEPLLIIQREYDGISDVHERLDMLALDKQGNLVIIVNGLDDMNGNAIWHALTSAAHCSDLAKEQITAIYQQYLDKLMPGASAEERLKTFFEKEDYDDIVLNQGFSQRIILVATDFSQDVAPALQWLMNFHLRIQCYKIKIYQMEEQLFLNLEPIIPTKDFRETLINVAEKSQDEWLAMDEPMTRHHVRIMFWKQLLAKLNQKTKLFRKVSPSQENWINAGTGIAFVAFTLVVSRTYARVELTLHRRNKEENKRIFDRLLEDREAIEAEFGDRLIWERLDNQKQSRIKYQLDGVNVFNEQDWDAMTEFMVDATVRMEKAFKKPLNELRLELSRGKV